MLTKHKYRLLFSSKTSSAVRSKGPTKELIDGRRNETAQSHVGLQANCPADRPRLRPSTDKGVVRRILGIHFQPEVGSSNSLTALYRLRRKRNANLRVS